MINRPKLNALDAILKQWIKSVSNYCVAFPGKKGDAPYWYNERATLSTFAGAVWTVGGLALEEYHATKVHEQSKRKGRIDLWFHWNENSFALEAKQLWIHLDERTIAESVVPKLDEKLKIAVAQVKEIPKSEGYRLGLVFIVPSIFTYDRNKIKELLAGFQNTLLRAKYDMLAWVFPRHARELMYHKLYPGVVVVAQIAEKN
jgi:hypothetical protein